MCINKKVKQILEFSLKLNVKDLKKIFSSHLFAALFFVLFLLPFSYISIFTMFIFVCRELSPFHTCSSRFLDCEARVVLFMYSANINTIKKYKATYFLCCFFFKIYSYSAGYKIKCNYFDFYCIFSFFWSNYIFFGFYIHDRSIFP